MSLEKKEDNQNNYKINNSLRKKIIDFEIRQKQMECKHKNDIEQLTLKMQDLQCELDILNADDYKNEIKKKMDQHDKSIIENAKKNAKTNGRVSILEKYFSQKTNTQQNLQTSNNSI